MLEDIEKIEVEVKNKMEFRNFQILKLISFWFLMFFSF